MTSNIPIIGGANSPPANKRLIVEIPVGYFSELKKVADENDIHVNAFAEQLLCKFAMNCAKQNVTKVLDAKAEFKEEDLPSNEKDVSL